MYPKHLKYMSMAHHQAMLSKALNHRVGAILVNNDTVIAQGYNGPPRGIPERDNWDRFPDPVYSLLIQKANEKHGQSEKYTWQMINTHMAHPDVDYDPRYLLGYQSGQGVKWQIDSHAERNAIFNAARIGVSTIGSSMYCWCGIPCKECAIAIIQAGITSIYCLDWNKKELNQQTESEVNDYNFYLSEYLLRQAHIPVLIINREQIKEYEESLGNGSPTLISSQETKNNK